MTKELTETTNELANLKTTTKNDLSSYYNQIQTLKSDTAKLQTRVQQQALEGLSKVQIAIFSGSDNQRMKDEFQKMVNDLKVHYEEQIETEIKWRKASDKEVAAIRGIDVVEVLSFFAGLFTVFLLVYRRNRKKNRKGNILDFFEGKWFLMHQISNSILIFSFVAATESHYF